MTNKQPYPEEFKIEAVKQITERHHRVADVPARIGVSHTACTSGSKLTQRRRPNGRRSYRRRKNCGV